MSRSDWPSLNRLKKQIVDEKINNDDEIKQNNKVLLVDTMMRVTLLEHRTFDYYFVYQMNVHRPLQSTDRSNDSMMMLTMMETPIEDPKEFHFDNDLILIYSHEEFHCH